MKNARELFMFLKGSWSLVISIDGFWKVRGVAKFTHEGDSLFYREDLSIDWGGFGPTGYQEYVYTIEGDDLYKKSKSQEILYKIVVNENYAIGHYKNQSYKHDALYTLKDNSFTLQNFISEGDVGNEILTEFTRLHEDLTLLGVAAEIPTT